MDVIALVTAEHDEIADLFDRLERSPTAITRETSVLVHRLAILMKVHARAEEKVVYEALRGRGPELDALALEGHYEHEAIEGITDRLIGQRSPEELHAMLRVARWLFEHHARGEEEGYVLPRLEAAIAPPERAALGRAFILERQRRQQIVERMLVPRDIPVHRVHVRRH